MGGKVVDKMRGFQISLVGTTYNIFRPNQKCLPGLAPPKLQCDAYIVHLPHNLSLSEITQFVEGSCNEKEMMKENGSEGPKFQQFNDFYYCIYPVFLAIWVLLLLLLPLEQLCKYNINKKTPETQRNTMGHDLTTFILD